MNEKTLHLDTHDLLSGPMDFARNKAGAIAALSVAVASLSYFLLQPPDSSEFSWALLAMLFPVWTFFFYQAFLCFGVRAHFRAIVIRMGELGRFLNVLSLLIVGVLVGLSIPILFYTFLKSGWISMVGMVFILSILIAISSSIPVLIAAGIVDFWHGRRSFSVVDFVGILLGIAIAAMAIVVLGFLEMGAIIAFVAGKTTGESNWLSLAVSIIVIVYILSFSIVIPALIRTLSKIQWRRAERRISPVSTAVFIALMVVGIGGTLYGWQSIKHERVYLKSQVVDDVVYLPPPAVLRVASLGYGSVWGDLLFVRTHAYYLRHMYGDQIFQWLETYADAVISLDPDNREIYYWASQVVRYGQSVSEEIVERSNRFAEEGLERFPDDARLYVHLGFNQYFELRPMFLEREQELHKELDTVWARIVAGECKKETNLLNYKEDLKNFRAIAKKANVEVSSTTEPDIILPYLTADIPGSGPLELWESMARWEQQVKALGACCRNLSTTRRQQLAEETAAERSGILDRLNLVRTQRNALEEQALVNYTTAAMLPHSAIDPIFLFELYIRQDQTEAAVHIAKSLYFDVSQQNRKQLLERLRIAGREEEASELAAAEQRHNAAMPYVNPELYRMVGSTDALVVPRSWDRLGEFFEALNAVRDQEQTEQEAL